jgi:hypothetical protein
MNIVYIIGNGFDMNLKLNTNYKSFYKYYKTIEAKTELIKNLKEDISSGITDWSDLELAFGAYTVKLEDIKQFDEVYEDIVDNLGDYLIAEESKLDTTKIDLPKFIENLGLPEHTLTDEDIQELRSFKRPWTNVDWKINIITLNYTRVIEKIFEDRTSNRPIGSHHHHQIILKNLQHIHGFTDKRTILGVNDISQIAKKDFHENEEILEALIKTKCNRVQRHNVDRKCEAYISEANLICIFGSSLGDTDNYWWQVIGEQLKRDARIIIFKKGAEIKERFGQKNARTRREVKKVFLDKTNLSEEEKKKFENNIYVGVNTKMFDILV